MRFRQLQALHSVMTTGTVTGAARSMGVSQPAISNLLSQLETQTGLALFRKVKGRLTPTPEANVLFREVDTVVRGLDQVSSTVTDLQNQRAGQLQIAATHAVSSGLLPRLISNFVADQPDIMISLQTRYSRNIQEWVGAHLFEIGITELPIDREGLEAEVFSFECRCAIPDEHDFTQGPVTPTDLDNIPMVVMGAEHMTHHRTREAFQQAGARLRIRAETHLFRSTLDFVKQGIGAALVDPFTLASDAGGGYSVHEFRPAIHVEMALIRSREKPMSHLGTRFYDLLRAALAEMSTEESAE